MRPAWAPVSLVCMSFLDAAPRAAESIHLVSWAGWPNFGDELIAARWLRFLAEHRPDAEVWLDVRHPGTVSSLLRGLHPRLHVTDTHRAYDFYTEVLGFRDVLVVPDKELYILGPSTGWEQGCQINLEPIPDELTRRYCEHQLREGLTALMLGVPDAETEYRRLKELGGLVFREELTKDAIGLHFQIEDTVGNILSIHTA